MSSSDTAIKGSHYHSTGFHRDTGSCIRNRHKKVSVASTKMSLKDTLEIIIKNSVTLVSSGSFSHFTDISYQLQLNTQSISVYQ